MQGEGTRYAGCGSEQGWRDLALRSHFCGFALPSYAVVLSGCWALKLCPIAGMAVLALPKTKADVQDIGIGKSIDIGPGASLSPYRNDIPNPESSIEA